MDDQIRQEFSLHLDRELTSLSFIQENKYCAIFRGTSSSGLCIIKKYKGEDTRLIRAEADALSFYHALARADPELIDSGEPLLREDQNLISIGFVPGDPFSKVLYEARRDDALRERAVRLIRILGRVLRTIREKTQRPGEDTSPFVFEYFDHCSRRLEHMRLLGPSVFRGIVSRGEKLVHAFRCCGEAPSFVHGDFVFLNIHVKDEKVGLIDFANANPRSHSLNDMYNLRFALANMLLPRSFKEDLLAGFHAGFGPLTFPEAVHRFYYEYHRRRWLMLKLTSRSPRDVAQGIRGLVSFARPLSPADRIP